MEKDINIDAPDWDINISSSKQETPMPTNNQEKWEIEFRENKNDKFEKRGYMEWENVVEFIRQEIHQAKIESWEECKKLFDQNLLYTEMDDAIQEAISNLKTNEKPIGV